MRGLVKVIAVVGVEGRYPLEASTVQYRHTGEVAVGYASEQVCSSLALPGMRGDGVHRQGGYATPTRLLGQQIAETEPGRVDGHKRDTADQLARLIDTEVVQRVGGGKPGGVLLGEGSHGVGGVAEAREVSGVGGQERGVGCTVVGNKRPQHEAGTHSSPAPAACPSRNPTTVNQPWSPVALFEASPLISRRHAPADVGSHL